MASAQSSSGPLNDKEKGEFDHANLDAIHAWKDVAKLRRMEAYMRSQGFPQTADVVVNRLQALNAATDIKGDEEARKRFDKEAAEAACDLLNWTKHISKQDRDISSATTDRELSCNTAGGPRPRADANLQSDKQASAASSAPMNKHGAKVRSGSEYYEGWEKFTRDELQKAQQEAEHESEQERQRLATAQIKAESAAPPPAQGPGNTKRIVDAASSLAPLERQLQAENEKVKGNDFFKAREYQQAIEAYTIALELDPTLTSARSNRAAAYIKVSMWEDAELDCSVALEQEASNCKALLRRARARLELRKFELALEDAEAALQQVPDDKDLLKIHEDASKALQKQSAKRIEIEEDDSDEDSAAGDETAADFIACNDFRGSRPGFVFKLGERGIGYYREVPALDQSSSVTAPAGGAQAPTTRQPEQAAEMRGVHERVGETGAPSAPTGKRVPITIVDDDDDDNDEEEEGEVGAAAAHAVGGTEAVAEPTRTRVSITVVDDDDDTDDEEPNAPGATQAASSTPAGAREPASAQSENAAAEQPAAKSGVDGKSGLASASATSGGVDLPSAPTLPPTPRSVAEDLKQQGNERFKERAFEDAVALFSRAADADPTWPVAYSNRAAAHMGRSSFDAAVKDASMALALDEPDRALRCKLLMRRAKARTSLKDLKGALADLHSAAACAASAGDKGQVEVERSSVRKTLKQREVEAAVADAKAKRARAAEESARVTKYKTVEIEELEDEEAVGDAQGKLQRQLESAAATMKIIIEAAERDVAAARERGAAIWAAHREIVADLQAQHEAAVAQAQDDCRRAESSASRTEQHAAAAPEVPSGGSEAPAVDASVVDEEPPQQQPAVPTPEETDGPVAASEEPPVKRVDNESTEASESAPERTAREFFKGTGSSAAASASVRESPAAPPSPGQSGDESASAASQAEAQRCKTLGNTAFAAQKYEDAVHWFSKGLAADPQSWACLGNRALAHLQATDYAEALADATALLERCPDADFRAKAQMRGGMALHQLGRLEEALDMLEECRRAQKTKSGKEVVHNEIKAVLKAMDRRTELGKSYVMVHPDASKTDAPSPAAKPADAAAAAAAAAPSPAASAPPGESSTVTESCEALRQRGNEAWKKKDAEAAIALWEQALALAPGDVRLHNNKSLALMHLGRVPEALEAAEGAVAAADADGDANGRAKALYRRGVAHRASGNLDQAVQDLERSQALCADKGTLTQLQATRAAADSSAQRTPSAPALQQPQQQQPEKVVHKMVVVSDDSEDESTRTGHSTDASGDSDFVHIQHPTSDAGEGGVALSALPRSDRQGSVTEFHVVQPSSNGGEGPRDGATAASSRTLSPSASQHGKSDSVAAAAELARAALLEAQRGIAASERPVPRTSNDFKKAASTLASNKAALVNYVKMIPTSAYKQVFKANMDKDILSHIRTAVEASVQDDREWAMSSLSSLKDVDRMGMLLMMDSKLRASFAALLADLEAQGSDVSSLRKVFK